MKDLTWIQTLYPEEAEAYAFQDDGSQNLPQAQATALGGPWEAAWDAFLSPPVFKPEANTMESEVTEVLPVPPPLPEADNEIAVPVTVPGTVGNNGDESNPTVGKKWHSDPCFGMYVLEGIVCGLIAITAIFSAVGMEIVAGIVYLMAVFMHLLSTPFGEIAIFVKAIFLLVARLMLIIDAIILIINVIVTEFLGLVATFLGSLLGGLQAGPAWRSYIRKTCHLTRWAFRNFHSDWEPKRIFPIQLDDEPAPEQPSDGGSGGDHQHSHVSYGEKDTASDDDKVTVGSQDQETGIM